MDERFVIQNPDGGEWDESEGDMVYPQKPVEWDIIKFGTRFLTQELADDDFEKFVKERYPEAVIVSVYE